VMNAMPDFITAVMRKEVIRLVEMNGSRDRARAKATPINVHIPSYDFGTLIDEIANDPQCTGKVKQVCEEIEGGFKGHILLPFPECLFMHQIREDQARPGSARSAGEPYKLVMHLQQQGDAVVTRNFFQFNAQGRVWAEKPYLLNFIHRVEGAALGDGKQNIERISVKASEEKEQYLRQGATFDYFYVLAACSLLTLVHEEKLATGTKRVGLSKSLLLSKSRKPVPDVTVIQVPRVHYTRVVGISSTGSKKSPHDRMAHLRRLPSGKVVTVRASKIHDGAKMPHQHIVRKPSNVGITVVGLED
jgi:hypothetical protein